MSDPFASLPVDIFLVILGFGLALPDRNSLRATCRSARRLTQHQTGHASVYLSSLEQRPAHMRAFVSSFQLLTSLKLAVGVATYSPCVLLTLMECLPPNLSHFALETPTLLMCEAMALAIERSTAGLASLAVTCLIPSSHTPVIPFASRPHAQLTSRLPQLTLQCAMFCPFVCHSALVSLTITQCMQLGPGVDLVSPFSQFTRDLLPSLQFLSITFAQNSSSTFDFGLPLPLPEDLSQVLHLELLNIALSSQHIRLLAASFPSLHELTMRALNFLPVPLQGFFPSTAWPHMQRLSLTQLTTTGLWGWGSCALRLPCEPSMPWPGLACGQCKSVMSLRTVHLLQTLMSMWCAGNLESLGIYTACPNNVGSMSVSSLCPRLRHLALDGILVDCHVWADMPHLRLVNIVHQNEVPYVQFRVAAELILRHCPDLKQLIVGGHPTTLFHHIKHKISKWVPTLYLWKGVKLRVAAFSLPATMPNADCEPAVVTLVP